MSEPRSIDGREILQLDGGDVTLPDGSTVSRRDFLLRAGQLGAVMALAAPRVGHALATDAARALSAAPRNGAVAQGMAGVMPESCFSGLEWRLLGPFRGGRVDAVTGVPGRPNEFYFGHVNGGVWKTVDAGRVWEPVFDSQRVASIGAIAVAPSAPDVVYVGNGRVDAARLGRVRQRHVQVDRWRQDAGPTSASPETQHIGKIAVASARIPDIVFVAAIGHLYAANPERGVFRSRDGGKTWQKVLYKDENVGAVEVVIDPVEPAGGLRRPVEYPPPALVLLRTDQRARRRHLQVHGRRDDLEAADRRAARRKASAGPASPWRRRNPRRVYAVVDCLLPEPGAAPPPAPAAGGRAGRSRPGAAGAGRLLPLRRRRGDAGRGCPSDNALWGRGWYFEKIAVDPKDPDMVYVPNVSVSRSMDGGQDVGTGARVAGRRRLPPGRGSRRTTPTR